MSQVAYSCIPTQQACSNCAPFYDSTCDPYSYGPPPPLCEEISTLSLSYTYSAGTCSIVLACNGGTPTFFPGGLTPAPGTVATCSESNGQCNCAPFYDASCDPGGYTGPPCEDIGSVNPSYTLSGSTCSVTLSCPGGGTPTYFPGGLVPAPGVAATCSESTGAWFLSGSGVNNMQCV
ncbi:hypothetical protein CAEBREN_11876 [Caenorhabditis brenneri]|uniref:Uncharacterized protein n=1 Tax=Caenorhabditis brenneri TaxID=135651 RepID=G0PCC8_CAEBE|nr:hypothetical protein CAEBREN_11876 [Caenorhabditis brenneri]